jgi:hypothetical protein
LINDVSEATVRRTIKKIEDVLIQSKQFHIQGKKALQPSDTVVEIVLVDTTEQTIERPKKDYAGITEAKRSVTPKKQNCSAQKMWVITRYKCIYVYILMIYNGGQYFLVPSQ